MTSGTNTKARSAAKDTEADETTAAEAATTVPKKAASKPAAKKAASKTAPKSAKAAPKGAKAAPKKAAKKGTASDDDLEDDVAELDDVDLSRFWAALACPTLLLRGERSDVLPREVADAMVRDAPHARLAEIAGVGHAPMLLDDAQVALVHSFLAEPQG